MELERALVAALLIVAFILITLYAVIIVFTPYLRTLLLALLFGSFLHPMKRSLAQFFKRILNEIRQDPVPILAGLAMPFSIIDKFVERLRLDFCHYICEILNFMKTIIERDWRSSLAVCLAATSLAVVGSNTVMNYVMSVNLVIFVVDIMKTGASFSDAYLNFLIRSFCFAQICWLHPHIIYLLIMIVTLWILLSHGASLFKNKLYQSLGLNEASSLENFGGDTTSDLDLTRTPDRHRVETSTTPEQATSLNGYARQSYNFLKRVYDMYIMQIEDYVDTISSACVIALVGTVVLLTTIYLSFQIYSESVYLIERVGIMANNLHQNNPELKAWLPAWLDVLHGILDGAVKNAYQHGREWIRNSTRQLLHNAAVDNEFNSTQSSMIEKQVVEFWDRAYALWLKNRQNATSGFQSGNTMKEHNPYDWDRFFDAFQSLDFALSTKVLKQNLDTLISVMDSLMIVVKGNLSVFLGIITATLSVVIGGGNVIMNFILNLIIFTTALFYLLCASQQQYKPIELVKNIMPANEPSIILRAKGLKNRNEFIHSVDESINGVFTASLKMMTFHGLSTWLLHRLFELEVVYIPAVISAVFGAIPFVSPYWASVPACLDLYLDGQVLQSILMLLLATVPSSFVTTAFYSEIKGAGHPYLTGLAIAGGVLVFGIDGTLFGPMLLVTIRLLSLIVVYLMDTYK